MKIGLFFALLTLIVGCVGKTTGTSERANISQEIRDAMALCSSQFSAEQSLFLEGWYLEYDAQVKAGLVGSSKGLVIDQSNMDGDQKLRLMEMYYKCVDSHTVKKDAELIITKSLLLPWKAFYHWEPLSFLSVEVMNLGSEPLLITSAEVALVDTNSLISREGQRIPAMSYLPHDNEPVLIPPGQKRLIDIRFGIRLDGLIPLINSLSVSGSDYSKVKIGNVNSYVVDHISLSDRFNDQIALLYGKDASLEVLLYVGLKTPVLSHRVYLSEGGNMYDNSGSVDWTRFLGELASIEPKR